MFTKKIRYVFLFLLVVMSNYFFINTYLLKQGSMIFCDIYTFITVMISIPYILIKNKGFILPVLLISFSILFSIFMANYSWNQTYTDSIKGTSPLILWVLFFYLIRHKIPIKFIENTALIYGIIYLFLYFFQFVNSSKVLFGYSEEFSDSRGIIRIVFPGGGLFFLSFFLALTKLKSEKSFNWLWIIYFLISLVCIIMQTTQQYNMAIFIIIIFHLLRESNVIKKTLTILTLLGLFFVINNTNNILSKSIKSSNSEHFDDGKDYIRILSGTYFLTEFSPNNVSRIFGNGVPKGVKSSYGRFNLNELQKSRGFHLSDVGLIAVYAMFGIFAVFGFIIIWIKSFTIPLPPNYYYLKYYLWFLLITCLTSYTIYDTNFLIANVFALYCYQKLYNIQLSNLKSMTST